MSSGGLHVHGPHDHELEHARGGHADHGQSGDAKEEANKCMTKQIALLTAVIAQMGAICAYLGGATKANAGMFKINAAIKKTEAANQWSCFQAKIALAGPAAGPMIRIQGNSPVGQAA